MTERGGEDSVVEEKVADRKTERLESPSSQSRRSFTKKESRNFVSGDLNKRVGRTKELTPARKRG